MYVAARLFARGTAVPILGTQLPVYFCVGIDGLGEQVNAREESTLFPIHHNKPLGTLTSKVPSAGQYEERPSIVSQGFERKDRDTQIDYTS